jgi:hypothetical protein
MVGGTGRFVMMGEVGDEEKALALMSDHGRTTGCRSGPGRARADGGEKGPGGADASEDDPTSVFSAGAPVPIGEGGTEAAHEEAWPEGASPPSNGALRVEEEREGKDERARERESERECERERACERERERGCETESESERERGSSCERGSERKGQGESSEGEPELA